MGQRGFIITVLLRFPVGPVSSSIPKLSSTEFRSASLYMLQRNRFYHSSPPTDLKFPLLCTISRTKSIGHKSKPGSFLHLFTESNTFFYPKNQNKMVSLKTIQFLALPALALADAAKVNSDSPAGSEAVADFPEGGSSSFKGEVTFTGLTNGSVEVSVDVSGIPTSGGPFLYHIHEAPVPSNGSCLATLDHFNPNDGNATCSTQPSIADCQLGDLSGKYGTIPQGETSFTASYVDEFLSLNSANDYYFADGKRSVVFHFSNLTRIACANIELKSAGNSTSSSSSSASSSTPISSSETSSAASSTASIVSTGSANQIVLSGAAAILAAFAALI